MFTRAIWSTLILSVAAASAISLAQNPDEEAATSLPLRAAQVAAEESEDAVDTSEEVHEERIAKRRTQSAEVHDSTPPGATSLYAVPVQTYQPQVAVHAYSGHGIGFVPQVVSPEEQRQAKEFHEAVAQLRQAKTDEDKEAARKGLNEMISAQLDRDFEQREQKLAEIEARAKQLREQLEQRRSSKAEIQKMLLMLVENPQAGLGLPPAWMNSLIQTPPGAVTMPAPHMLPLTVPRIAAPGNTPSYPAQPAK